MVHVYVALIIGVIAAIVAVYGYKKAARGSQYGLYVEAARPSEIGAGVPAFYGGTVATVEGQPQLVTEYSKQPCVWYEYVIQQERQQQMGNSGQTTSGWHTLSRGGPNSVMFALQSSEGMVYVNPVNAQVDQPQRYEQFIEQMNGQAGGVAGAVANVVNVVSAIEGNRTRVVESYIPVGQHLYAGGVALDQNGQRVFSSDTHYPLVLTPQSKTELVNGSRRTGWTSYAVAALLAVAAAVVLVALKK